MKLSEALIRRSSLKKAIAQIKERMQKSARHMEGQKPDEDPNALLASLMRAVDEQTALVRRINKTNVQATFKDGMSIMEALAERDMLVEKWKSLRELAKAATEKGSYGFSEVKYFTAVDVPALYAEADDIARAWQDLDARIQAMNWEVELAG